MHSILMFRMIFYVWLNLHCIMVCCTSATLVLGGQHISQYRGYTIPQTFDEMLTPLKRKTFPPHNPTLKCSPGVSWGQFVQPVFIPRFTCIICAKFIPNRSSRLTTFPRSFSQVPPWGIVGRIVFSLCPFPDESTDVYRIWCQSVHPFGSFPRLKFVTP